MISQLIVPEANGALTFSSPARVSDTARIYGGQVFAQALMAAAQTVASDRLVHSAHAYFLRGGDDAQPVQFDVDVDFDGGSFSNRHVVARQNGHTILNLTASFHRQGAGDLAPSSLPEVPGPEQAVDLNEYLRRHGDRHFPDHTHIVRRLRAFDVCIVNGPLTFGENSGGDHVRIWFRLNEEIGADQTLNRGVLAYFSDFSLLASSLQRDHIVWSSDLVQMSTIDHALWIHDHVAMGEWMLYSSESPWRANGRGYSRGQFFSRDGRLIASTTQEGVVRITT
jgi:acyl-CoA thioesterase-2